MAHQAQRPACLPLPKSDIDPGLAAGYIYERCWFVRQLIANARHGGFGHAMSAEVAAGSAKLRNAKAAKVIAYVGQLRVGVAQDA